MTRLQLTESRTRMAWSQAELGRRLEPWDAEWLALLRSLAISDVVVEDDSREAIHRAPRGI